jgi:hypothetical protein
MADSRGRQTLESSLDISSNTHGRLNDAIVSTGEYALDFIEPVLTQ